MSNTIKKGARWLFNSSFLSIYFDSSLLARYSLHVEWHEWGGNQLDIQFDGYHIYTRIPKILYQHLLKRTKHYRYVCGDWK